MPEETWGPAVRAFIALQSSRGAFIAVSNAFVVSAIFSNAGGDAGCLKQTDSIPLRGCKSRWCAPAPSGAAEPFADCRIGWAGSSWTQASLITTPYIVTQLLLCWFLPVIGSICDEVRGGARSIAAIGSGVAAVFMLGCGLAIVGGAWGVSLVCAYAALTFWFLSIGAVFAFLPSLASSASGTVRISNAAAGGLVFYSMLCVGISSFCAGRGTSEGTVACIGSLLCGGGILLALVFRAAFIVAGTVLLQLFAWMMPLLGLFLIYTGYTTWGEEEEEEGEGEGAEDDNARSEAFARAAEESFVVRQLSKVLPLITRYDPQGRLLVKQAPVAKGEGLLGGGGGGAGAPRWHATPQLIVLVAIAASDVVFAMDSIPAILSITTDPFLVITSNCFAVMGLRSLFFVLAALQSMFKYLQQALAVILAAVGAKMVLGYFEVHCSILGFLVFMVGVLVLAMVASIAAVKEEKKVEKMMRQPQMLPASFNPRAATHVVRPQPMQVRGRKIPDWVAAQRQQAAGLS